MAGFKVLITMDTTEQSEECFQLLPMLKTVGFDKVRLLSIWDAKQRRPAREDGRYSDVTWTAETVGQYLQDQVPHLQEMGFEVETEVAQGDPAQMGAKAAAAPDVDLLLVATHGRTGIARMRLGSVADKLIKDAVCPVLVIGPNVEIDLAHFSLKRIMVPLDGSPMSELSLPLAKYLARLTGAELELFQSVSAVGVAAADPMAATVDFLSPMIEGAETYLGNVAQTMAGLKVAINAQPGAPAESILARLRTHEVDLVVLASHGRTGFARMALGSVAERVLHGPDPVLIFEPNEDKGAFFAAARAEA
jgi:nucleotide-binding universal stress UspA family protein